MSRVVINCLKKVLRVHSFKEEIDRVLRFLYRKIYKKTYTSSDLIIIMQSMGMREGSNVFIHSSMREFYNYRGTAKEFIEAILQVIGSEGTLMMPAFPKNVRKLLNRDGINFSLSEEPSGAGYLSEEFRKYPGVKRSINIQHSVCAIGKLASFFTCTHHLSDTCWDVFSPYYKMSQVSTLIFSFGLTPYLRNVTVVHCAESVFKNKYKYFNSFWGEKITYCYQDLDGRKGVHNMLLPIKGGKRSRYKVKKYLGRDKLSRTRLSNLLIEMVDAQEMYSLIVRLAEVGKTLYDKPSTRKFLSKGKLIECDC